MEPPAAVPRRRAPVVVRAGLLALAAALTACGSTVAVDTATGAPVARVDGGAPLGLSDGLSAPVGGDPTAETGTELPATAPGAPGTALTGGTSSGSAGEAGAAGTSDAAPTTTTTGGRPAPAQRGGGPIDLGLLYVSDQNTYVRGAGLENLATGDHRSEQQWFVDALNAAGGVLGRKVRPVFHEIRSSDSAEQISVSACARFTQDQRVTAVAGGGSFQGLRACLRQAGIPHVAGIAAASRLTTAELRRHPLLVEVGGVSVDRLAAAMPDALRRGGFPQAGGGTPVKVGIVTYDARAYRAAAETLVAAFRRRGLEVAEVQFVRQDQDPSDVGIISNQMSGAVLRMRSDGVTHMTFLEDHGLVGGLFMTQAESQGYRPFYGVSSGTLPQVLAGTVPEAQLTRVVGFGWFPAADVADPKSAKTASYDRCLKILAAQGDRPANANALSLALLFCDNIFATAAVLTAGGQANAEGFATGLRKGVDFPSAATFRSLLSTQRQDGASAYRPLAYRGDCRCFTYTGPAVTF